MLELNRDLKQFILHNESDYPELSRIIKAQNKYRFERDAYFDSLKQQTKVN